MNAAPAERAAESTWTKLRRRKVVQWGVAYAAGAWLLMQVLAYFSGTYDWPRQLQQLTTLALLFGLPIVLVLAWYHGDRGQQRITTPEFAILTLLLLLGGGAFWYYQRANETHKAPSTAVQPAAPAAPLEAAAAPDAKSIAVLPFVDMSAAKDQEYMSDGIAEELLNLLAKVPDLKVIARTSSFAYKGKDAKIADIARDLNVAHVLEGSVRKAGDRVRITAQLIHAADSTHVWSETYDRTLADIFAMQDEIASAIAQALQIKFMGGALERHEGGTQNLKAYELVLRARKAYEEYTEASLDTAEHYLVQAVELDPGYGTAWNLLASVVTSKTDEYFLPAREGYERARQLAQRASDLSPGLAGPHVTLQNIYIGYGDWPAAQSAGQRALALDPTHPSALLIAALLDRAFGRWEEAERKLRRALLRDPVNPFQYFNLGSMYYGAGRLAESEEMYRRVLELAPDFLGNRAYLGKTLLVADKPEAALQMVQHETNPLNRALYLPAVLRALGRNAEADEALESLITDGADRGAFYVAQNYAYRGEHDLALQWLERAYQQRDPWLFEIVGEHLFDSMADDPRFKAFLRKMKLPERPGA